MVNIIVCFVVVLRKIPRWENYQTIIWKLIGLTSKRICPQSVESTVSGSRGGFEGVGMSPAHHDRTTYDL